MPPKQTEIGKRLKAARAKANLSQAGAAKEWNLSKRTLQHWEQGRREPRGLARVALEEILRKAEA